MQTVALQLVSNHRRHDFGVVSSPELVFSGLPGCSRSIPDIQASNLCMPSDHPARTGTHLWRAYQLMRPDALDLLPFGALSLVEIPTELQVHPEIGRCAEKPSEP